MRAKRLAVFATLIATLWAAPLLGTAHSFAPATRQKQNDRPWPTHFRLDQDRGLLLTVWINDRGPFVFAIDTGAGMNLITQDVAVRSGLTIRSVRPVSLGGLSGALTRTSREAVIPTLALGDRGNTIQASKTAMVVPALASGLDGILDPVDVYAPLGFSIDMPNRQIEAVDQLNAFAGEAREGAVVPWLRIGSSERPFVRLGDGRLALVDTGSGYGLAVNGRNAIIVNSQNKRQTNTRDVAGGRISSRRVQPTTISIGALVLRSVPTDILFGVTDDAPVILGRDLLYPFKMTFNPQKRLIEFVTSSRS